MAGYIGKISAIVTANTSDFSRKMQGLPKDVERFSRSLQSSLNSASSNAQKSLEKIFTPLQQLERKLKTASDKGLNLKLPVDQIRSFVSVAEGVNKPIEKLAGGFTKLSAEVQAEFLPALSRVQSQAVTLALALERNGTVSERSFDIVIRKIEETELAYARLAQAQQIASRGLTGRELQFVSPSVFQSLNRTADLTQRAGGLPADRLADGGIAAKVQQLDRAGQKLQARFAELETLRLTPNVDSSLIEAAERRVNRLVTFIKAAQDNLETLVSDPPTPPDLGFRDGNPTGVFGPQRPDDSAALIARERAQRNAELARETLAGSRFAAQFGGGSGGLKGLFDQQALRGYSAQLQVLQGVLGGVSAEARGPASTAFLRLRDAIADAMDRGEIETEETRLKVKALTAEAVTAAAQVSNTSEKALGRKLSSVGDIARGSFGNASLAIQQAAFAIDDFFSVTGGLDQRIRAAGNNISQLGFVLGGTTGLIVGIAASITSQLVVALIKWQNAGVGTEERVKSLNDAVARQKSLVESLAEAYRSVADAIERTGFSNETQQLRQREKLIDDIRKKQAEIERARVVDLDPEVQRERGIQAARQRELEQEADPGERVRIVREIQQSRAREAAAADAAAARRPNARSAVDAVAGARFRIQQASIQAAAGLTPEESSQRLEQARLDAARFTDQQGGRLAGIQDPRQRAEEAIKLIEQAQAEIASQVTTGFEGFFDGANVARRAELARLEQIRASIERDAGRIAANDAALQGIEQSLRTSEAIGVSLSVLSESLGGGSSRIAFELEKVSNTLTQAQDRLADAATAGDLDAAEAARAEIEILADVASNLNAAANAASIFAQALNRASQLADTVAQEAQGRSEDARRRRNEVAASLRNNDPDSIRTPGDRFVGARLNDAAQAAREAEDRARNVRSEVTRLRRGFEERVLAGQVGGADGELLEERSRLQRELSAGGLSVADQQARQDRVGEIDSILSRLFELSIEGQKARELADEADIEATRVRQRFESEDRGFGLLETDAQRAARNLAQGLLDIDAAVERANERARELGGAPNLEIPEEERQAARQRLIEDAFRQAAPAVFALRDQVDNAVLQGPSRAALTASDITTQAGTAELNRLLRGDDSARDQNLVELQRQTKLLEDISTGVNGAQVAE